MVASPITRERVQSYSRLNYLDINVRVKKVKPLIHGAAVAYGNPFSSRGAKPDGERSEIAQQEMVKDLDRSIPVI